MNPILTVADARAARQGNPEQWYRADDNRLWKADTHTIGWVSTDRPGGIAIHGNDADAVAAGIVALVPDATTVPREIDAQVVYSELIAVISSRAARNVVRTYIAEFGKHAGLSETTRLAALADFDRYTAEIDTEPRDVDKVDPKIRRHTVERSVAAPAVGDTLTAIANTGEVVLSVLDAIEVHLGPQARESARQFGTSLLSSARDLTAKNHTPAYFTPREDLAPKPIVTGDDGLLTAEADDQPTDDDEVADALGLIEAMSPNLDPDFTAALKVVAEERAQDRDVHLRQIALGNAVDLLARHGSTTIDFVLSAAGHFETYLRGEAK